MIKPNIGWTPQEGAELFYEAARGGVDVIKDDELLSADMPFCPMAERVPLFMEMEKRAFEETGEHTLYAVNITDSVARLKDNAYRAIDLGRKLPHDQLLHSRLSRIEVSRDSLIQYSYLEMLLKQIQ